jgi:hypothetical protein
MRKSLKFKQLDSRGVIKELTIPIDEIKSYLYQAETEESHAIITIYLKSGDCHMLANKHWPNSLEKLDAAFPEFESKEKP